jgi:hypothetical protein
MKGMMKHFPFMTNLVQRMKKISEKFGAETPE